MADDGVRTADLPAAAVLDDFLGNSTGVTSRAAADDVSSQLLGAGHGLAAKVSPVDADELILLDSENGFAARRMTWADLKAAIAVAFDLTEV